MGFGFGKNMGKRTGGMGLYDMPEEVLTQLLRDAVMIGGSVRLLVLTSSTLRNKVRDTILPQPHLYILGGSKNSMGHDCLDTVSSLCLNSKSNSRESWRACTPLTLKRSHMCCVVAMGHLYVIGGTTLKVAQRNMFQNSY